MIYQRKKIADFWFPIIIAIIIYSIGDVLLKIGNIEVGSDFVSIFNANFWISFILNLQIVFAFISALISKLIMGFVLSKNPLGVSEGTFLAISAILTFLFGAIIFNEDIFLLDVFAISLISIGILLIFYQNNLESENEN